MSSEHDIGTSTNHKAWIEKIQAELKGKDLNKYDYVWDGEHVSPFEALQPIRRILSHKENNEWYPGCEVNINDKASNERILSALELGAAALRMEVDRIWPWEKIFKRVHLDWIHSEFEVNDKNVWEDISRYLFNFPKDKMNGICWIKEDMQQFFFEKYREGLPGFRFLTIQVNVYDSSKVIAEKIKKLLNRITILSERYGSKDILDRVAIKFEGGEDLVLNISMLRAFRLIWMQSLKSAGIDAYAYEIFISATVPFIKSTPSDQMIAASLIATSLVLGGIDSIYIANPDLTKPDARWGLMAQHILKEEARLHIVHDPLAGSHVVERLTGLIGKKIWSQL